MIRGAVAKPLLPGASVLVFLGWDTIVAYTTKYPILPVKRSLILISLQQGKKSDNSEYSYLPNVGCKERDRLQWRKGHLAPWSGR